MNRLVIAVFGMCAGAGLASAESLNCSNAEGSIQRQDIGFGGEWHYQGEVIDAEETWEGAPQAIEERSLPDGTKMALTVRKIFLSSRSGSLQLRDSLICRRLYRD